MRVAIIGAGAMGSLLGHGFCKGGHQVSILDLPDRIGQLQATGIISVVSPQGEETSVRPHRISTDYSQLGEQDVVVLATKSQALPGIAKRISEIPGDNAAVVTIQNGIPWWYLRNLQHNFGRDQIKCLDPDGLLHKFIDPDRIVGCVAYPAATMEPDGKVYHVEGNRFPIGELDGSESERTRLISELFETSGFKSRIIKDIRSEIWLKAWGALSINPISALTRATMEQICTFAETRELVAQMMQEAKQVAEAFGASFRHTIEKRIEGAKAVGAHKTSMLQDVERQRTLELDGLMLAVLELADLAGVKVPTIRSIYACTALLNESLMVTDKN